jgi:hypothetical protein
MVAWGDLEASPRRLGIKSIPGEKSGDERVRT